MADQDDDLESKDSEPIDDLLASNDSASNNMTPISPININIHPSSPDQGAPEQNGFLASLGKASSDLGGAFGSAASGINDAMNRRYTASVEASGGNDIPEYEPSRNGAHVQSQQNVNQSAPQNSQGLAPATYDQNAKQAQTAAPSQQQNQNIEATSNPQAQPAVQAIKKNQQSAALRNDAQKIDDGTFQMPQMPQPPQQISQEMQKEAADWYEDLNNGHVKPVSYRSLFANESTLGKIGTIFGLLVGGAGAGLSHQPNMLMEMMNKEIDNDMKAQQESKGNAQNFLKLGMENQTTQANVKLAKMQAQAVAAGIPLTQAQTAAAWKEAQIKGQTLTFMRMYGAVAHQLGFLSNQLPPGSPQQQKAQAMHSVLVQHFANKSQQMADQAGQQISGLQQATYNPAQSTVHAPVYEGPQGQNQSQQISGPDTINGSVPMSNSRMANAGIMTSFLPKIPGAPDLESGFQNMQSHVFNGVPSVYGQTANSPILPHDRSQVVQIQTVNEQIKQLQNLMKRFSITPSNIVHLDPSVRQRADEMAKEIQQYLASSAGEATEGRMRWAKDVVSAGNPLDLRKQIFGYPARLDQLLNSNEIRKNQILEGYGLHPRQVKTYQGRKYVRGDNGKAIPVD